MPTFRTFQAVYYRAGDGSQPVDDFVDGLPVPHQVALDNHIDRLNDLHPGQPHLPFPHSSQIRGELRELRCHYGRSLYRILYRRSGTLIILLHALSKNASRVPEGDIAIAEQRWEDFKARMDGSPRKPPRAAVTMPHDVHRVVLPSLIRWAPRRSRSIPPAKGRDVRGHESTWRPGA